VDVRTYQESILIVALLVLGLHMHNFVEKKIGHALLGDAEEYDVRPVFEVSDLGVIVQLPSFGLPIINLLAHENQRMCSYGAGEGVQIILPKLLIIQSYGISDPLNEAGKEKKPFTEIPSLKLSIT
jgi:hypothetical protein